MKYISKSRLWEAQVQEYPKSVRLTIAEVYRWCDEQSDNTEKRLQRYMQVALALQCPSVVFYRIEGTPYRGFRFGLHGSEYMSIYSN